ncbi:MAG: PPC domain-containing protein [Kofleriaceae bacterium]
MRLLAIGLAILTIGCADAPGPDRDGKGGVVGGKTDGDGLPSLDNNVRRDGLAAQWGDALEFRLELPPGIETLSLSTSGGSGDADLYLRKGLRVWGGGGGDEYDFKSATWGNDEAIDVTDPDSGSWYVAVQAATGFSGVSLVASYDEPQASTEVEPNEQFAEANQLTAPGKIVGTIPDETDFDTFRIVASGKVKLRLDVPAGADLDLTLWDADEHVIDEGFGTTGEPEEIEHTLHPDPRVYYITVEPYLENTSREPYTLSADW